MDEARRRAEQARDDARPSCKRVEQQLRDERGTRRDREAKVEREAEARGAAGPRGRGRRSRRPAAAEEMAETRLAVKPTGLATPSGASASPSGSSRRRGDGPAVASHGPSTPRSSTPLAAAAERARALAADLDARRPGGRPLTRAGGRRAGRRRRCGPGVGAPGARGVVRRATPLCPPGMRTDRPDALDAMLRTRGVVLVVDGYNVSMLGWRESTVAEQRDRLVVRALGACTSSCAATW